MSDSSTLNEKDLNEQEKISSLFSIDVKTAEQILNQLGVRHPPVSEIHEIVLVVKHD